VPQRHRKFCLITVLLGILYAHTESVYAFQSDEQTISPSELAKYFTPTIEPKEFDQQKIDLGRMLFHDPTLSSNGEVSCASCHIVHDGGDDGRAVSIGVSGRPSSRNSPSVIYAGEHLSQFWDGRSVTLNDQIDGPIHNPDEMNSNWDDIEAELKKVPVYVTKFRSLYQRSPNRADIKDAIVAFERSLGKFNSRFDRFIAGDETALNRDQKEGASIFVSLGCVSCHQGPLLGGTMYHKLGVMHKYFHDDLGGIDTGRYNVTKRERDRYFFKVPSLRNVDKTAPYLHDGSIGSLETIVATMAFHQLGRHLDENESTKIVAFLKSLSDEPIAVEVDTKK